jgi:DNA-binding Xre family transcriptional regulator
LVSGTPVRISLPLLAALCDVLACSPADLIRVYGEPSL